MCDDIPCLESSRNHVKNMIQCDKEPYVNYAQHELIPFVKEPIEVLAFCRVNMVLSNFKA